MTRPTPMAPQTRVREVPELRRARSVPVIVLVMIAGAIAFSPLARAVLPEQFLLDDGHIRSTMTSAFAWNDAVSFQRIADLYRSAGLIDAPAVVAIVNVAIFAAITLRAAGWYRLSRSGLTGLFVLAVSLGCATAYLGQFSKEIVTLAVVAVFVSVPRTPAGEAVAIAAMLLYAWWLRPYWLIIAVLYLSWRLVMLRPALRHPLVLLAGATAAYVALQVAFQLVLGTDLTAPREQVNMFRSAADTGSYIGNPLPGEGPVAVVNALLILLTLLFPVPLLLTGGTTHAITALTLGVLWALLLRWLASSSRETAPWPRQVHPRALQYAALLLAVVCVQAVFEPDYGSALKHLTPLLPLFHAFTPLADLEESDTP